MVGVNLLCKHSTSARPKDDKTLVLFVIPSASAVPTHTVAFCCFNELSKAQVWIQEIRFSSSSVMKLS